VSRAVRVASALYGLSILLSRVIGLIREGVIGRVLGDSAQADVYWVAFILPDFLNYLLAGGALSLVLIPLMQSAAARGGERAAWDCFWRITSPLAVFALGLTTLAWLSVDQLTELLAPGFKPQQREELIYLTRIILPGQIFHLIGASLSAKLQAHDRHRAPALAPLLYAGSIALSGLIFGERFGAEAFAWGVLVGSALGPFGCPLIALLRRGEGGRLSGRPRWELRHEELRSYLWRALPVMLGFSIVALDELIVKRFGTHLGEGSVAQLHYARTLMKVPMGVFGLALGMAAFPTLSRYCAQGRRAEALRLLGRSFKALLLLAALSQVALTACSAELAALIWGRERLSDEALSFIGSYCGALSLGLWAWASQGLIARGFYAMGQTWRPTLLGSVVTAAAVPLYLWASQLSPLALCFASSAAISSYVASLWWWVSRALRAEADHAETDHAETGSIEHERSASEPMALNIAKIALASAAGVAVARALNEHLGGVAAWGEGVTGVIWPAALKLAGSLGVTLCLIITLKIDVVSELSLKLKRRLALGSS